MVRTAKYPINTFIELGRQLTAALDNGELTPVIDQAIAENVWFTPESIEYAIRAICNDMLQPTKLEQWLAQYPVPATSVRKKVGIIMAGNIPLVGFFDLMCVLLCGHICLYKSSSKDQVLTDHIVQMLQKIDPDLVLHKLAANDTLDAIIATGSDNTNRYFRSEYHDIPALIRGSRHSIAVLSGDESPADLQKLGDDIFTYFGLGCRNVSQIFVPETYDIKTLVAVLQKRCITFEPFLHNYRQTRALNQMLNHRYIDGGFFVLCEGEEPSNRISEITLTRYHTLTDVETWIQQHDNKIQCCVSTCIHHPRTVTFGQAQHPTPEDYPDGIDVIKFLQGI